MVELKLPGAHHESWSRDAAGHPFAPSFGPSLVSPHWCGGSYSCVFLMIPASSSCCQPPPKYLQVHWLGWVSLAKLLLQVMESYPGCTVCDRRGFIGERGDGISEGRDGDCCKKVSNCEGKGVKEPSYLKNPDYLTCASQARQV